jgi:uncharacterized protein YjbJ (UPF0337 family)
MINKEQVKGKIKEAAGEVQKQVGKVTGNTEQQAKGQARELEGQAEKKLGDLKESVKDVTRKP